MGFLQTLMDFCHFGEFGLDARVFIFAPIAGLGWLFAYIDGPMTACSTAAT